MKRVLASKKIVATTRRLIGSISPHMAPPMGFSQQLEGQRVKEESRIGSLVERVSQERRNGVIEVVLLSKKNVNSQPP